MKITVQVKTNSKKEGVLAMEDGSFQVRVNVPPIEGRANERIRELLADHFDIPKSHVEILSGLKGKKKIIEINER